MNRLCSYVSRYIIPVVRDRVISENAELAGFPQFSKVLYTQRVRVWKRHAEELDRVHRERC